ncbi:MAG TPA: hypothetical protein VNA04_16810 [Thermoanaerobaculia bacterium]|nr:hypothetical protein [Thermoanaerobaculia bacterium]
MNVSDPEKLHLRSGAFVATLGIVLLLAGIFSALGVNRTTGLIGGAALILCGLALSARRPQELPWGSVDHFILPRLKDAAVRTIDMTVLLNGTNVTFEFATPLLINTVMVLTPTGEPVWEISAERTDLRKNAASEPMDRPVQLDGRSNREDESTSPLLASLQYGYAPDGFKTRTPATSLTTGVYHAFIIAVQGNASAPFQIGSDIERRPNSA